MMRVLTRTRRRRAGKAARGFTLIELLVVIGIIVLLVALLAPAVMAAMRMAKALKTQRRIAELSQAALSFYKEKSYYPGQRGFDKDQEGNTLTGCQQLALDLFGPDLTKPNRVFASCLLNDNNSKSDLFDPFLVSPKYAKRALANSISDRYGSKPMAILYFPSRAGQAPKDQYVEADNDPYLVKTTLGDGSFNAWQGGSFFNFIKDPRLGSVPNKRDQFIFIGPGMDREYGTDDDLKNW